MVLVLSSHLKSIRTRTLPLVPTAVAVPWVVGYDGAVVEVGREHKDIVEDPLHEVLCLLLTPLVERGHARSGLYPGTEGWVIREISVEVHSTLKNLC